MKLITITYFLIVFDFGIAAVVEISTPDSAVALGSNIIFSVTKLSPSHFDRRFDRLDCAIISPDDQIHKKIVAQFDKHSVKFKAPSHGIPEEYRNRISYVGNLSFVIEQIQYSDKFLKVMCILNYKEGSLTSHVESTIYKIEVVYVAAAFQFYSTKEGNVTVIQGQKKILQCIVKSFPQSNIFWEGSIGINAYTVKMEKTEYKKEITTKSIFILDSPTRNHDGKKVVCVVRPTYGAILQRRFTLIYKSGKDETNHAIALSNAIGDYSCYYVLIYTLLYIML